MWTVTFQMFKLVLEKAEEQEVKLQHPLDHRKSKKVPEKHLFLLYCLCQSLWLCGSQWSEVAQSCLTLCNPVDCSLPGSSVHGILQSRILEWVTISFSRGSSRPGDQTRVSRIGGRRFNLWDTDHNKLWKILKEMGIPDHLTDLPLEKPICRSGSNSWNWTWNNRLVPNRKRSMSRLYIVALLIYLLCRTTS